MKEGSVGWNHGEREWILTMMAEAFVGELMGGLEVARWR